MHRQTLQCLPKPSTVSNITRCYAQQAATSKKTHPPPPPYDPEVNAARWTTKLIKRAAAKDRSHGFRFTPGQASKDLRQSVQKKGSFARIPSNEQSQFFAESVEDQDLHREEELQRTQQQEPGTFAEVRRNQTVSHCVVLSSGLRDGQQRFWALSSTGEIWDHLNDDALFTIPNFISKEHILRCGSGYVAEDDHQATARVEVLKKLREFNKKVESEFVNMAGYFSTAYEKFRATDPNQWSQVTTQEVAREITKGKRPSTVQLLCVHKHLMRKDHHFVAHHTHFFLNNIFYVRPLKQAQVLQEVSKLVLRENGALDDFAGKASRLVEQFREREKQSWLESPTLLPPPKPFRFSVDDTRFIRFLQDSLRSIRSIQNDPYTVPVSMIMKRIPAYANDAITNVEVHRFLIELGVKPPWDDPTTLPQDLEFLNHPSASQRTLPEEARRSSAASVFQNLGPDEFYSKDLVESVRHDFGDLPVYVIDDFGAEELDDGISIESIPNEPDVYWVHAHIADPTAVLHPAHRAAQNAHCQGSTLYFTLGTIPMLGGLPGFSGFDSKTTKPERTLTFSFKIDKMGEILDYAVRAGLVRNVHILKYDDVDLRLGLGLAHSHYPFGGEPSLPLNPYGITDSQAADLQLINKITARLVERRRKMDCLTSQIGSANVVLRQKPLPGIPPVNSTLHISPSKKLMESQIFRGFPSLQYSVIQGSVIETGARGMVSECMKAASRVASLFFRDRSIPALRRAAGRASIPTEEILQDLLDQRDEFCNVDYTSVVKNNVFFQPGGYVLHPGEHWQMGVKEGEGYCRVTSPLRRYCDLVAHWQIKHALLNPRYTSTPLFSEEWLKKFAVDFAIQENKTNKLYKTQTAFWACQFIKRWLDHPVADRSSLLEAYGLQEDPLENLFAMRVSSIRTDIDTRLGSAPMFLPSLGIKGILTGLEAHDLPDIDIGQSVRVKVDGVRLGLKPLLYLKRV